MTALPVNPSLALAERVLQALQTFKASQPALSEQALRQAVESPAQMPREAYLLLQACAESMDLDVAKGQDCTEGFDALAQEVCRLQEASPWTMHPDYGCVLASAVDELDTQHSAGPAASA